MFFPNLKRFVWRRHYGAHPDGHQNGGRKKKTAVTEFWCKSVNLFVEELINIKVILFLMIDRKIPRNTSLFYPNDSFLERHVNATSRKSLKIQAFSITKPRTLCMKISLQLLE